MKRRSFLFVLALLSSSRGFAAGSGSSKLLPGHYGIPSDKWDLFIHLDTGYAHIEGKNAWEMFGIGFGGNVWFTKKIAATLTGTVHMMAGDFGPDDDGIRPGLLVNGGVRYRF